MVGTEEIIIKCIVAFGGGLAPEIYVFHKMTHIQKKFSLPKYITSWPYILSSLGMCVFGSLLALIHFLDGALLTYFLALHIGASTPIVLGKLSKLSAPSIEE